jgi:hypothetical protein
MLRLVPDSGVAAEWVRTLLAEPEMAALLAAAPGPMWRTLRPLCRMLGVERPAMLAPPPRPATPKPPKPKPPPPPPDSPYYRVASAQWPRGVRARPRTA